MNWYRKSKVMKLASLSIYISGYSRDDRFDNLLNICFYLNNYVWGHWLSDDMASNYFREFPSVTRDMVITPDGDSFDKLTGVINFYIGGIIPDKVKPILDWVINYLESNGIIIGEVRKEKSKIFVGDVIRIPILSNFKAERVRLEDKPPDFNLSNGNAFFIFNKVLGYDRDLWDDGIFDALELKRRIGYFLGESDLPEGEYAGQSYIKVEPKSKGELEEVFEDVDRLTGRSGESTYTDADVRRRLLEIERVCDWALGHGYKELYLA